jgi:hypothetical protein
MGKKSGSGIRMEKCGSDIYIPDPQQWLVIRIQESKNGPPKVKVDELDILSGSTTGICKSFKVV